MTVFVEEGNRHSRQWVGRWREKQNPPFIKPLRYKLCAGTQTGWDAPDSRVDDLRNTCPLANEFWHEGTRVESQNKALNKVYDRLAQSEALLVAFKERQSSLNMMATRLGSLVSIARAVKRRDPKIVRRVLKRNPSAKDIVKQPAGLWLEYWFGWAPLVSDIHHAAGVFAFEFPVDTFSCSSGSSFERAWKENNDTERTFWDNYKTITKIGGSIYTLDPNVQLATMLGFGQPLSVAWELTPFSWCIDYVVNVGELVKNLEPRFPGVKVKDQFTSTYATYQGYRSYYHRSQKRHLYNHYTGAMFERKTSWPNFQLSFNNPLDLSGQRVSYLASVFVQILSGMKKS